MDRRGGDALTSDDQTFGWCDAALSYQQVAVIYAYREGERVRSREWVRLIEQVALAKIRVELAGWSDDPEELSKAKEALLQLIIYQKTKGGRRRESNANRAETRGTGETTADAGGLPAYEWVATPAGFRKVARRKPKAGQATAAQVGSQAANRTTPTDSPERNPASGV